MHKVMLFIDGTWLYRNLPALASQMGKPSFRIDYGKLPRVLAQQLSEELAFGQADAERAVNQAEVVRTYLFGSYPDRYDPQDKRLVESTLDFYDMLKMEYHFELELFPIDFRNQRVRREDRADDENELAEKCVDVALATNMVYLATVPGVFDIAIVTIGDKDFMPALKLVRRLGKRIAIASIRSSCSHEFLDLYDRAGVRDFDVIWLDDLLNELELKYELHAQECQHANHDGDRMVETTFRPRKNQVFYCETCRELMRSLTRRGSRPADGNSAIPELLPPAITLPARQGRIKVLKRDRLFGFIAGPNSRDYYFHANDLDGSITFDKLEEGMPVEFSLKGDDTAESEKAPPVTRVRVVAAEPLEAF